ncbi:beta-1,3-galactosyltransferase GALT1-like [Mercurialis annua]|uniref:beta-1,3-galactosyltransferase GALT1-like n=1 Tax=Mercurialis annua TaxID=3986 RepID=UPI00215E4440|nr:beta-1,3-galactosyltransferase GALT1-like [Mercurialis annua]XP_050226263.1 beta-1,3-galactosyltransferase GALT1-like [Mercurialis annua]
MKKWVWVVPIGSFLMLLILREILMRNLPRESSSLQSPVIPVNLSNPLQWVDAGAPPSFRSPESASRVISSEGMLSSLFVDRNFSNQVQSSLLTWNFMRYFLNYSRPLPNGMSAIKEAQLAWETLMDNGEQDGGNESLHKDVKEKQCPYFVNIMNATEFGDNGYKLRIPCGLIQGSTITIIGTPGGLLGDFRIDLSGDQLPGEQEPPILLHYNVRILGDKITKDPVIVQNTWTAAHDWGTEVRCPPSDDKKVDELSQCDKMVGKDDGQNFAAGRSSDNSSSMSRSATGARQHFPFKKGYLSVMTLRMGEEGIQMTVDGKHITSFACRENLEPWLVSEVRISGDLKLVSVLASGLPSSEESEHIVDLESLKSAQFLPHHPLDLFIGVFSTANNFERRMAVRRTWMQYPAVKTGEVAVRFFVGLHKNQMVNEQLWDELKTYGDIQLMPFVDYYSLITWKTVAICTFGSEVISAKNVMKTDDDAFVRVDEVIASLKRTNVSHGLLYGLINYNAQPHRDLSSKWYISPEEWPESSYPPWAHGPGYVVSYDIAKAVYKKHKKGQLKMFKLEDVAMGMWIAEMQKEGLQVSYVNDNRVCIEGCKNGYVVAHYQSPREMLCLWKNLQDGSKPGCCSGK